MADAVPRAKAIMVLGTSSHAGKSTVVAALCRALARKGYRVAPFKAQNMSNNSWVTPEGAEIGRAQASQARAAGIEPHADMNPILLKPSGGRSQVVALGKAIGEMDAREFYARNAEMRAMAHAAYDRLASRFDVVVMEGAGSPAEINLRDQDLVNMAMAEHAGAECILVADIERGGVFAAILGTLTLMPVPKRARMAGVLINKFRGDASLLDPGIREITAQTGVPILGVLPWLDLTGLDEEDSLALERDAMGTPARQTLIDLAVVRFPHISNFTDFALLEAMPECGLRYVSTPETLGNPDLIFLPGSKQVRSDLAWLRETGLDRVVRAAAARGIPVMGICGGYQALGESIDDPFGVEGQAGSAAGLGLLKVVTRMEREKETRRVEGENAGLPFLRAGTPLTGYEIHMGQTEPLGEGRPALLMRDGQTEGIRRPSGMVADALPVWGCYLHGLFDTHTVRRDLVLWLLARKGLSPTEPGTAVPGGDPYDRLADWLEGHFHPVSLLGDPKIPQIPGESIQNEAQ